MAVRVRWWSWVAGVVGASVVIALALPRVRTGARRSEVQVIGADAQRELDEAQRAWLSARQARRLAEFAVATDAQVAQRRREGLAPGAVLIDGARSSADSLAAASLHRRALDAAWDRLGLGPAKVGVGLVVLMRPVQPVGRGPDDAVLPAERWSFRTVVVPDAADPGQCLLVLVNRFAPRDAGARMAPDVDAIADWLVTELGACAFVARYGVPGRAVRIWLESREYDVAGSSNWLAPATSTAPLTTDQLPYEVLYMLPPDVVGCAAGRPSACREALRVTTDRLGGDARIAPIVRGSRLTEIGPLGAHHLLADVARAAGPVAFAAFWTSELDADSALSLALGEPVGAWMARWQRREVRPPLLGPVPSRVSVLASLVLIAGGVAVAVMQSRRREVR